jgi:peroxiredoxin
MRLPMNLKPALSILLLFAVITAKAQQGYEIKVTLKPFTSGYLFLAHYYGQKQALVDSVPINQNSQAVFSGKEKLPGGIYLIAYPKKDGYFELIIDKEQKFSVAADSANLFPSIKFTGSKENQLFKDYQDFTNVVGSQINSLQKAYSTASNKADSTRIAAELKTRNATLKDYRQKFVSENPGHLLSTVFNVLIEPEIPPTWKDSSLIYQYYKAHFWDGVNLADVRLLRTPVFQPKFNRYFDEVLPQHPDSLIVEADEMMFAARSEKEMRQYMLTTFTEKYINPKYMGQDAVFVHLFQKYFITGEADSWMTEKYKKFVFDRGYSLMANVIGEKGANLNLVDTLGKKLSLYDVKAPYTVVCFWDPTCSHCQVEVPKLDSLYKNKWKAMGVTIFGVMTDGGKDKWVAYIREHNLKGWIHVYQTKEMKDAEVKANQPGFRQLYDVYQTPMLYLLDADKKILAKKLSYEQLNDFLDHKIKSPGTK